jgi:hypothetical protein
MSVEIFLPPKAHVEGAPNLANGGFAVELDARALGPSLRQTKKCIPLGSERDEALAAKGKDKNQEQIDKNMER